MGAGGRHFFHFNTKIVPVPVRTGPKLSFFALVFSDRIDDMEKSGIIFSFQQEAEQGRQSVQSVQNANDVYR